jgi:hypothetical protein
MPNPPNNLEVVGNESTRELCAKLLAKEFLNVPEIAYELRAYALEALLPTLSLGMEHLSIEIQKKGLEMSAESENKNNLELAPAAEKSDGPPFHPINWLGNFYFF